MLTPSLDPLRNTPSLEQRQLNWAYRFLLALAKEATFVHAAVGLGGAAGGVMLAYLPLSPLYVTITVPFLLLGMMFMCGAIAKSVLRRSRRRRKKHQRSR